MLDTNAQEMDEQDLVLVNNQHTLGLCRERVMIVNLHTLMTSPRGE
jgi:hypothetical protein